MSRIIAESLVIALFVAICFGLQYHWNRRPRNAVAPRARPYAELASFGVYGSARVSPLLRPQAIGHAALVGKTDEKLPPAPAASPRTRAFFEKLSKGDSTRWLRLVVTPQGGRLRRQVVVLRRQKSGRSREVTFDLKPVDAGIITTAQMEAIVEASFAEARKNLMPSAMPPAASQSPAAANQPLAAIPNVRRIKKDVVGGVLENFGHEKRKFGDKPEFTDYFVDIKQTDGTVERIWGSALQDEVKRTSAQRGDRVVVTFLGRKPVEVGEGGNAQKKLYQIQFAAQPAAA